MTRRREVGRREGAEKRQCAQDIHCTDVVVQPPVWLPTPKVKEMMSRSRLTEAALRAAATGGSSEFIPGGGRKLTLNTVYRLDARAHTHESAYTHRLSRRERERESRERETHTHTH